MAFMVRRKLFIGVHGVLHSTRCEWLCYEYRTWSWSRYDTDAKRWQLRRYAEAAAARHGGVVVSTTKEG